MCVAAVIFEKVPLNYLQSMEQDNPHGAGIAWEQDGGIYFLKGLTAQEIYDLQEAGAMTYPYLLHFRWATHGDKVPELTHPFPLGPRALLGETSGMADRVLIHNGTWGFYESRVERFMNEGNYELPEELVNSGSDTALAAWLAAYDEEILDSVMWATVLAEMRWTTDLEGNEKRTMDITTRGTWYDKDGNWYSNLNWVPGTSYGNSSYWRNWSSESWKADGEGCESGAGESTYSYKPPSHSGYDDDGWSHYKSTDIAFDAEKRVNDRMYVGKHSDIVVDLKFYDKWSGAKDDFKPELVGWHDWYCRFWGNSIKDIKIDGKITSEQTKGKEAREEAIDKCARDPVHPAQVVAAPNALVDSRQSWHDYLTAKYGHEVARDIHGCFFAEADDPEAEGDGAVETDEALLDGWDRSPAAPEWLHDGDVITDDPSAVNAWLARQTLGEAA